LTLAEGEILRIPLDARAWVRYGRVVRLGGVEFAAKGEAHITVVNKELGRELEGRIAEHPSVDSRIRAAIETAGWLGAGDSYPRGALYHVAKEKDRVDDQGRPFRLHAESIIQQVEVPGIDAFYGFVGAIVGRPLEAPPTHVTLCVLGDPRGISLADQRAFDRYVTREISPDELIWGC
jgi:hypothetical protein